MAEEVKPKRNFLKLGLFVMGPIALLGVGVGVGAFLFMPTQSPVEQVEALIEKKLKEAGQLPSEAGDNEEDAEPQKVTKETPVSENFVTSYYNFADNFTTNLKASKQFLQVSVGVSTQYDETVIENVEKHQMALRSEVLGTIGTFTVDDVEGKLGRDNLASKIQDARVLVAWKVYILHLLYFSNRTRKIWLALVSYQTTK
jgi:flagellar FliL protein